MPRSLVYTLASPEDGSVSVESGIQGSVLLSRGAGGLWRTYSAPDLASPQAFAANPSLGTFLSCEISLGEPFFIAVHNSEDGRNMPILRYPVIFSVLDP